MITLFYHTTQVSFKRLTFCLKIEYIAFRKRRYFFVINIEYQRRNSWEFIDARSLVFREKKEPDVYWEILLHYKQTLSKAKGKKIVFGVFVTEKKNMLCIKKISNNGCLLFCLIWNTFKCIKDRKMMWAIAKASIWQTKKNKKTIVKKL